MKIERRIEHMAAATATHPPVRDPELVAHHLEGGGAGGATRDEAHEGAIVGLGPRRDAMPAAPFAPGRALGASAFSGVPS